MRVLLRLALLPAAWVLGGCTSDVASSDAPGDPSEPESGIDAREPRADSELRDPESNPDPRPGGSTGDFNGRCACTKTTRELQLSEADEVLGFSAEDLLGRVEGEYALPMVWGDSCADESPTAEGCADAAPVFTGSETEVQIAIGRDGSTARVDDCASEATPECRVTWLIVPVAGTVATADGLLAETFEVEIRAKSLDELSLGEERLSPAELDGTLAVQMPQLAYVSWGFGLDRVEAWFEVHGVVLYSSTSRSRARAESPDGRPRAGHSSGVAVDLEEARR